MTTDLISPHMDKGWSFQIYTKPPEYIPDDVRGSIVSLLQTPIVKKAHPFLQADCLGWIMVEFWTDDENAILTAANYLNNSIAFAAK